jgi:uncharacterized protein (TIGR03083 family)
VDRTDTDTAAAQLDIDFAEALLEQNRLFADLVLHADPSAPVPTCPDWTITQLLRHVGRGDRWAAAMVRDRVESPLDPRTVPGGKPPADRDGALRWLHESPQTLLDAVERVGSESPCWTFVGSRPAAWWIRRRLHETLVHRADAAIAVGADFPVDAALAADSLSEWLDIVAGTSLKRESAPLDEGTSVHLHATDDRLGPAGEWLIAPAGGGVTWNHGHRKASVAVRGRAVDLLLAAVRRQPAQASGRAESSGTEASGLAESSGTEASGLEVIGDVDVWKRWLERTPF